MEQLTERNMHRITEGSIAYIIYGRGNGDQREDVIKFDREVLSRFDGYPWAQYHSIVYRYESEFLRSDLNIGPFLRRPEVFKMYFLEKHEVDPILALFALGVTDMESIELICKTASAYKEA